MFSGVTFAAASLCTAAAVIGLLIAERANARRGVAVAKTLASLGFLSAAWAAGAMGSLYGRVILVGLVLCFFGDVLLIPKSRSCFLAGLASFLIGHLAFAAACVVRGVDWPVAALSAVVLAIPAIAVARWLGPHVDAKMRAPVLAYIVAITVMVALAAGSFRYRASWLLAAGAFGFYLSDLSVARDRFVAQGFVNRLWGLPLYYAAVLLLAASSGAG
jgi:uncharacterized membrane protein YhhN